jgi:hypothetical protein
MFRSCTSPISAVGLGTYMAFLSPCPPPQRRRRTRQPPRQQPPRPTTVHFPGQCNCVLTATNVHGQSTAMGGEYVGPLPVDDGDLISQSDVDNRNVFIGLTGTRAVISPTVGNLLTCDTVLRYGHWICHLSTPCALPQLAATASRTRANNSLTAEGSTALIAWTRALTAHATARVPCWRTGSTAGLTPAPTACTGVCTCAYPDYTGTDNFGGEASGVIPFPRPTATQTRFERLGRYGRTSEDGPAPRTSTPLRGSLRR